MQGFSLSDLTNRLLDGFDKAERLANANAISICPPLPRSA
jgi:hypothetical protein